jgi:serine/threonine protein kinase
MEYRDLPLLDKMDIVVDCLEGAQYLHVNGIGHFDIKPENIIVNSLGRCKLGDLGLARRIGTAHFELIKGTISHLPPEAFRNRMGFASDIWSIGVIFYELLT